MHPKVQFNIIYGLANMSILFCFLACKSYNKVTVQYKSFYEFPQSANTHFGGISGIDYNRDLDLYYLVSDDRSKHDAARFYNAKILIENDKVNTILIQRVLKTKDGNGDFFNLEASDFESIRYLKASKKLIIGNEGGKNDNPSILFFDIEGNFIKKLPLSATYLSNLRDNKSFEAIDISKDEKAIYYSSEEPLVSDGLPSSFKTKGKLKIIKRNITDGSIVTSFAYNLEELPQPAIARPPWGGMGVDNGLSDLLFLNDSTFLTIERSGAYKGNNEFNFVCNLFANYIIKRRNREPYLIKKRIFGFNAIPISDEQNIEGMTLGPVIENNQTLLFASDNNFSRRPTVFYLFHLNMKK